MEQDTIEEIQEKADRFESQYNKLKEDLQSEEKYTQMTFDDIMEMVEKIVGNEPN